jgi:hypothetical protein
VILSVANFLAHFNVEHGDSSWREGWEARATGPTPAL